MNGIWNAYVQNERELGYLTTKIYSCLELLAHDIVGDNVLWGRSLITDFRFACFAELVFELWQPSQWLRRRQLRLESIATSPRDDRPLQRGDVEWSDEQIDILIAHVRHVEPDFVAEYLRRMDEVGFAGFEFGTAVCEHAERHTAHPSDLSVGGVVGAVNERLISLHEFKMYRPENQALREKLFKEYSYDNANDEVTFDAWVIRISSSR